MKLTDNEIKKALECCSQNTEHDCNYCPYFVDDEITTTQCMCNLMKLALDLINRRDTEIERLNKEVDRLSQVVLYHDGHIADAKSEARKEFADRLKAEVDIRPTYSKEQNKYVFFLIDNLLKEMERENDK